MIKDCEAKAWHETNKPPRHCRGGFLHSRRLSVHRPRSANPSS
jgi:hypothetical protein